MVADRQSKQELVAPRRVLVAEDFSPFRQFVCERLQERSDLSVIPVADGRAAVRAAEDLQPDLALLDIGLPRLNGIAAAKDIRARSRAKVAFLTQESSPEIVDAARDLGARGYIHKTRAHYLLPFVDAMLAGDARSNGRNHSHARRHEVHLFPDDSALVASAERFVIATLANEDAAVVALTRAHLDALETRLRRLPAIVDRAKAQGTFVMLDAGDVLSFVTASGRPDLNALRGGWHQLIATAGAATRRSEQHVAVFSEIAPHVLANGHTEMAITLEQIGEELCAAHDLPALDIVCVYTALPSKDEFKRLCETHSLVTIR